MEKVNKQQKIPLYSQSIFAFSKRGRTKESHVKKRRIPYFLIKTTCDTFSNIFFFGEKNVILVVF